jgi:hypothetical protein
MPPTVEERLARPETQMRGVLDHLDTIVWFRDTLKATQEGLVTLRGEVEEMHADMRKGFGAAATRVEIAELHREVREGFETVLARLPKDKGSDRP